MHASPAVHADTASQVAVRTDRLTKRFGDVVTVDELTLTVTAGEVLGFLGPNGAGKSTTLRLLLGLIRPSAGRAQIFGVDAKDVTRAHKLLAYLPADVALWPALTGAEILELLGNVGPNVDVDYRTELSSGNRQKVALVWPVHPRPRCAPWPRPTSLR